MFFSLKKYFSKSFAIIGGGPAGFYTAKLLLKKFKTDSIVHIFDKNIFPFGLIRYGVAPDH